MKAVDGQRTISSPYHLIKGKKSGQTIQDIGYFNLHPFFGVLPKLEKSDYLAAVARLQSTGMLEPEAEQVRLTARGFEVPLPTTPLNGWKYRGNERRFFARLSLIVQTMSCFIQGQNRFDPVVSDEAIQNWVKTYLHRIHFRDSVVQHEFRMQLESMLERADAASWQKDIIIERLSGFNIGGLTWDQIANRGKIFPIDAQLAAVEVLHASLAVLEEHQPPLLISLLEGVIQQSALTESAKRTQSLFERGFSLQQIAELRQLKTSTIEDHFVELAMNDPAFLYTLFMDATVYEMIHKTSEELKTMRLRDIKQQLPEASYFQIRLALAMRGAGK
nr:helix-turn-helix domain-containing protein [Planococcus sp. ISL-109]